MMVKNYAALCRQAKGTRTQVGPAKNYVFLGLAMGLTATPGKDAAGEECRDELKRVVLDRCGTSEGQIDMTKATELAEVVAHAQVTKGKDIVYLNIRLHEAFGGLWTLLEKELMKLGERQWDPPPPKPVMRDLRRWREEQRQ